MARDTVTQKARERDSEQSLLDRRSYLRLAGATAAAVGMGSAAVSAQTASYDTITVSSGETRRIDIRDGETLENTLIDVTADGARASIRAYGGNWTIRNVAVKGELPQEDEILIVCYDDQGGVSRIENCYFGGGSRGEDNDGYTGCFVHARHSGTLKVNNCYFGNWTDNALYASPPGNPACDFSGSNVGQGGTVEVTDSYFTNNNVSNIRLGTEGSFARNCVVDGGDHRGLWSYYETTRWENCDVANIDRAVEVGGSSHYLCDGDVTAVVDNCRSDGQTVENAPSGGDGSMLHVQGSLQSSPETTPPEGVPVSAEAAASGTSSASGGGSGSSGDGSSGDGSDETTTESGSDGEGTVLELIANANASNATYEFTVEGSVSKRTNADDVSAEASDTVTDNGDGTVTVSGVAGNGYGDSYRVSGTVTSMSLNESQWTVRYDGSEVSVAELTESASSQLPNKLVIDGSNRPQVASTYTFEVSGQARKSSALGTVNDHDTISEGTISGRIIGGTDGYRFSGEITGFTLDGPANVRVEDGS